MSNEIVTGGKEAKTNRCT